MTTEDSTTEQSEVAATPPSPSRRRPVRRAVPFTLLTLLGAGAALTASLGVAPTSDAGAAAAMRDAVSNTLSTSGVAISVHGTLETQGESFALTGQGQADLASRVASLTVQTSLNGVALDETVVDDGTTTYMSMDVNGASLANRLGGRHWVAFPQPSSSAMTGVGSGGDPLGSLRSLLGAQSVASLAPRQVDGVSVTGYQATLDPSTLLAKARADLAGSGLTDSQMTTILDSFDLSEMGITVWVDAAHRVVREILDLSLASGGVPVREHVTVDYSHYGTPVTVAIPASSDVVSLSAFLSAAAG